MSSPAERFPFPTSRSHPATALTPPGDDAPPPKRRIRFGVLKGQIWIGDDFDAPLPEPVLASFGSVQ